MRSPSTSMIPCFSMPVRARGRTVWRLECGAVGCPTLSHVAFGFQPAPPIAAHPPDSISLSSLAASSPRASSCHTARFSSSTRSSAPAAYLQVGLKAGGSLAGVHSRAHAFRASNPQSLHVLHRCFGSCYNTSAYPSCHQSSCQPAPGPYILAGTRYPYCVGSSLGR